MNEVQQAPSTISDSSQIESPTGLIETLVSGMRKNMLVELIRRN